MTVEEVRVRLRRKLEGMLGEDEAAMLMDRPPGGWGDVVTNQSLTAILDERFDALERRLDRRFDAIDRRFETIDRRFDEVDHRFDKVGYSFDAVDQDFETQEHKLKSEMDKLARDQTWRMVTVLLTGMSILTLAFSVLLVLTGR